MAVQKDASSSGQKRAIGAQGRESDVEDSLRGADRAGPRASKWPSKSGQLWKRLPGIRRRNGEKHATREEVGRVL
eukprot:1116011-Ditylum_brightwellii.AAC.1